MNNILDITIIFILLLFIILGLKRGVIKEAVSLIGIILVFILSFAFKGIIGNLLCTFLPFFRFTGSIEGLTTLNIFLYQAIAFFLTFSILSAIYAIVIAISKVIQKIVNMTIILILPSALLGGLISLIKGYIIVAVTLILLIIPFGNIDIFKESKCVNIMVYHTPVLSSYVSKFTKPLSDVYKLGDNITKKTISINDANLKALDIMLQYKIVSKDEIIRLIELHKLDDIKGIEDILDNY